MASSIKKRNNTSLLKICISFLEKLLKKNCRFIFTLLLCYLLYQGLSGVAADEVSMFVMERDSVTFKTGVETNQHRRIRWYFNSTRIAQITGDLSKICTDVQCNAGTERFRDRLKLDHQTGSLTIRDIRTTDSGEYELKISSKNHGEKDKTFNFAIHDVSAAEPDEMKKEGENVTLYAGLINPNDVLRWYFDDTLITEITGDQSKICIDERCSEIFRDRLKLDHQTGSLTIMNTRTTDSGVYQQQIYSSRFSIVRNFTVSVTVTAVRDPGPPSTAAAGTNAAIIVGAVLLVAFVICCWHKRCTKQNDTEEQKNHDEENGAHLLSGQDYIEMNVVNGRTTDQVVVNETS